MSDLTWEAAERENEIHSVVRVIQTMHRKYEFPSANLASGPTDPDLTIEDMATKSEILKKLQCNLLPAIKEQITSLLKSILDMDEEYPNPDAELTRGILSDLDQTLQATTDSILTLADGSPLPDEKHDHCLERLKTFRCSQLRLKIKHIVRYVAKILLGAYVALMQSRTMAVLVADRAWAWEDASESKESISLWTAHCLDIIDGTISWSLESDWAIVRRNWLREVGEFNDLLDFFTQEANPSLASTLDLARFTVSLTGDTRLVEQTLLQTRRTAARKQKAEAASSIVPIVKLVRILVRKLLKMIPNTPRAEPDCRINSETMKQLHDAFGSMSGPLMSIMSSFTFLYGEREAIWNIDVRDNILCSLNDLKKNLETTSTIIALRLMPLLHGAEHASPASDFKAWSLPLEQAWDKVLERLLNLVSSFGVESESPLDQGD
ncbi:hypothetical protein Pst134EB_014833 [Puccinia striiformis f. sp. tritici]|nr:hypothetical protein Pst134EB_014833 [Puccinia striiformis f. sp. tritici]